MSHNRANTEYSAALHLAQWNSEQSHKQKNCQPQIPERDESFVTPTLTDNKMFVCPSNYQEK